MRLTDEAIRVDEASVSYGRGKKAHRVVDRVSFVLPRGKTLGIIGESGSGKTTLCRALLGLVPVESGSIIMGSLDMATTTPRLRRRLRRHYQAVFQDPFSSFDPRWRLGRALAEPLAINKEGTKGSRSELLESLVAQVGLPVEVLRQYPHKLSGGQRQRLAIARALALSPETLILDEPLSALDVSVQAQISNLLVELQQERNLSYVIVAHDMAAVRRISDYILVMQRGKAVEFGAAEEVFSHPSHAYTRELLNDSQSLERVLVDRQRDPVHSLNRGKNT
jgi:ABC-type glutathione transport system ATPase component